MNFTGVIIPFYNGEQYIEKCVDSILTNGVPAKHVYIVDNSPREHSLDNLKAAHQDLNIIRTEPGIGFGRACNAGAAIALKHGASQVIITNQDTILDHHCVERLVAALNEMPNVSILAPLNYTYGFEGVESSFVRYYLAQCPSLVADAVEGTLKSVYDVEKILGSCFIIRADCIRALGLFDELYFMYSEDDDMCRRYRLAGRRIAFAAKARVAHAHSLTAAKDEKRIEMWSRRSTLLYTLKDVQVPFWGCAARAIFSSISDYLRCFGRGELGKLFRQVGSDLRDITMIPAVLRSRRRERSMVNPQQTRAAVPGSLRKVIAGSGENKR